MGMSARPSKHNGLTALNVWRGKVAEIPAVKNRSGQKILPGDLERLGV
jgi:hypothetical protein